MLFRCKKWVVNCRLKSLEHMPVLKLHQRLLCGEHFEDCMFLNPNMKNRLRHDAVPTLFAVPNPPKLVGMQRRQIVRHSTGTYVPSNYSIIVITSQIRALHRIHIISIRQVLVPLQKVTSFANY